MKRKINLTALIIMILMCLSGLSSCLNNDDDDTRWSQFNGIVVTVRGDDLLGYRFYTDFGAVLVPTTESISQVSWLRDVWRAMISFSLKDNYGERMQLESGETYEIVLNTTSGANQEIPAFVVAIDTLSEAYQMYGQDSIMQKNKAISALDKTTGKFYIKNGYLNLTTTFDYDPYQPVSFLLYYDGNKDVDIAGGKLTLNLFFTNNTQNSYGTTSSFMSFRIPEELYYHFEYGGIKDNDSIDVCLKAKTISGPENVYCKMSLKDFMLP